MSSLGMRPNRRRFAHTLPGSTASVPPLPQSKNSQNEMNDIRLKVKRVLAERDVAYPPRRVDVIPDRKATPTPPDPHPEKDAPVPSEREEAVFAVAMKDIFSDDGQPLAMEGEKVCLVYPMTADEETGVIRMRMKTIHKVTGQISLTECTVYDPSNDTRIVSDFTLW